MGIDNCSVISEAFVTHNLLAEFHGGYITCDCRDSRVSVCITVSINCCGNTPSVQKCFCGWQGVLLFKWSINFKYFNI